MKKFLPYILICFVFSAFAQDVPDDIKEQKRRLETIAKEALPVEVEVMPSVINSPYSEYKGMVLPDSTFVFTALHSNDATDNEEIFTPFWTTKMYKSQLTISGFSSPEPFHKNINHKKYYISNFTFNKLRNVVYFSRCAKETSIDLQCHICKSEYKNGEWSKPEKLPMIINTPNDNTTFPHLVEKEEYEVLYFSSNRSNGEGGLDIWYSIIKDDEYQTPINLGSYINSTGNEITPYYDEVENKLYFSSDHWFGIGGYDVFYSEGELGQWKKAINVGPPVNTEYNDFYFVINEFNRNGYFSSNRPNNLHRSLDDCCNDLFSFKWKEEVQDNPPTQDAIVAEKKPKWELPVLYFANDQPNPKSIDTVTRENYATLLANYLSIKEEYIAKAVQLSKNNKEETSAAMKAFFQDSVVQGYRNLELMTEDVCKDLHNGEEVTLVIQGYASALHNSQYNVYLSQRRIESVINYFKAYKNGELLSFIESKKLRFVKQPFGSEKANTKLKKGNYDKKNAVYSLPTSLDRKIGIVEIRL